MKNKPIKNSMKQDLRKGGLRNEKCIRCGVKMKRCSCGVGDPRAKVNAIMEEKKEAIAQFKEEQIKERMKELNQFTDKFVKEENTDD